jgi:hypothetical protein
MKKLPLPTVNFPTALSTAISGVGDAAHGQMYTAAFPHPNTIELQYAHHAAAANLYLLPRVSGIDDQIIFNGLLKSQLTKLYTQYFVPEKKPGRRLYDAIKASAKGKCPLCGGVGHVKTLDHYLPKANFPLYSVMPANLVPCCKDCNSEKLNAFSHVRNEQTLHPYFDHDRFFTDKWIRARVIPEMPPVLDYFVAPPVYWQGDDQRRVESHFDEYDLADKFSIEAAADIPETILTRKKTMQDSSPEEFASYLAEKGNNPSLPINNWRRVMFNALSTDAWFCAQSFDDV